MAGVICWGEQYIAGFLYLSHDGISAMSTASRNNIVQRREGMLRRCETVMLCTAVRGDVPRDLMVHLCRALLSPGAQ